MNEKKQMYEAPVAEVIVVNTEANFLDGSIKGNRSSYGAAQTDNWD